MKHEYHFKVLYEKLGEGSYRAWAPVLPACQASGSSLTQAQARIQEAIRCYCLNMLENGAVIPQTVPGLPAVVHEIHVDLGTA